jgi:hypothetical protein
MMQVLGGTGNDSSYVSWQLADGLCVHRTIQKAHGRGSSISSPKAHGLLAQSDQINRPAGRRFSPAAAPSRAIRGYRRLEAQEIPP